MRVSRIEDGTCNVVCFNLLKHIESLLSFVARKADTYFLICLWRKLACLFRSSFWWALEVPQWPCTTSIVKQFLPGSAAVMATRRPGMITVVFEMLQPPLEKTTMPSLLSFTDGKTRTFQSCLKVLLRSWIACLKLSLEEHRQALLQVS